MDTTVKSFDVVIIGGGPGGLQMGYFLEKAGRSYVILESRCQGETFFKEQPRHRKLLSINKKFNFYPEAEFNLRHDWNSLLTNDNDKSMPFTSYSDDLFPGADDMNRYLVDFEAVFKLNVLHDTRVTMVKKENEQFNVLDVKGDVYRANRLFVATGPCEPWIPYNIEGIEHALGYEDYDTRPASYKNKRVAIVGRGNSAFEIADSLASTAAYVHILVGKPVKLAWDTHFVGDLRAVNNSALDLYMLKSMHATLGFHVLKIAKTGSTLNVTVREDVPHWKVPGTQVNVVEYDVIIRATGWKYADMSIFDENCKPKMDERQKFPVLNATWEASVPKMHFIGTSMQAKDKRSASGFIHGFRYNIRSLFHMIQEEDLKIPLPQQRFSTQSREDVLALSNFIISRVSTVSSLYQLNGFMVDTYAYQPESSSVVLFKELPSECVTNRFNTQFFTCSLEYGFDNYPATSSRIKFIHPADSSDTACSAFLHPVFQWYSEKGTKPHIMHLGESLVLRYDVYDYDNNNRAAHLNMIYNFLCDVLPHLKEFERLPTSAYTLHNFTPWTEEQLVEWKNSNPDDMQPSCNITNK